MAKLRILLGILFFTTLTVLMAQNNQCENALPICAGDGSRPITYENNITGDAGGNIGDVVQTPNPSWFYFRIGQSGIINLELSQGEYPSYDNFDLDYVCWGPFDAVPTCDQLYDYPDGNVTPTNNIHQSAYSNNKKETLTISNAEEGKYYMIMIPNSKSNIGYITIKQTNIGQANAGATDCNLGESYCETTKAVLDATTTNAKDYFWEKDGNALSEQIAKLEVDNTSYGPGIYKVMVISDKGQELRETSFQVKFNKLPKVDIGADASICSDSSYEMDGTPSNIAQLNSPPRYQWYKDDVMISGAISPKYSATEFGEYYVEVTNETCVVESSPVVIDIIQAPNTGTASPTEVCQASADPTIMLGTLLTGADTGGEWKNSKGEHVQAGYFDYSEGKVTPGEYKFTYTVKATVPCTTDAVTEVIVIVKNVEIVATPPDINVCDDDSDGDDQNGVISNLDLTINSSDIIGAQQDVSVTYYTSESGAEEGTTASTVINNDTSYTNTEPYEQKIYFRVEDNDGLCYRTGYFKLFVSKQPHIVKQPKTVTLCDITNTGDGVEVFDLTTQQDDMLGEEQEITEFAFAYYTSLSDAENDQNPIVDPAKYTNTSNPQTIYVKLNSRVKPYCYTTASFQINVDPVPTFSGVATLKQCDDNNDGTTLFNLQEVEDFLTSSSSNTTASYTFTYYKNEIDAKTQQNAIDDPTAYQNTTPNTDKVWVAISDNASANGCSAITTIDLTVVSTKITLNQTISRTTCEITPNSGVGMFDLTEIKTEIENLFPVPTDIVVSFYESISDALAEQNEITDLVHYENSKSPQQLLTVRVESILSNECMDLAEVVELNVLPNNIDVDIDEEVYMCTGAGSSSTVILVPNTIDPSYTYSWEDANGNTISSTNAAIEVSTTGDYYLYISNGTCDDIPVKVTVLESQESLLTTEDLEVSQFSDPVTLDIPTGTQYGMGNYSYSLDNIDGPYDTNTHISGLSGGDHILYVKDLNGCNLHEVPFSIFGYMTSFTPNGDGYNDYWTLKGDTSLTFNLKGELNIFDKFGRLLAVLDLEGQGWDGTYNGIDMPSTDYWFVLTLDNGTEKKGHFSLIRR